MELVELPELKATQETHPNDHPEITRLINYNKSLINRWNEIKSTLNNQLQLRENERKNFCSELEFLTNLIVQQESIIGAMRQQFTSESITEHEIPDHINDWTPIKDSGVESVIAHKQLKYEGNKYNYHHARKDHIFVYKCNKYRTLRCPCQILMNSKDNTVCHRYLHNHKTMEKVDKPLGLSEARRAEVYFYLRDHPNERNPIQICENLNSRLQPWEKSDPRFFVRNVDVREMLRMFQGPQVSSIEDLVTRSDLALTEDGHPFLLHASVMPFCLIWGSPWQINYFQTSVKTNDQLFIDGTFRIAPYGTKQLVTLMYCRSDPDTHTMRDEEAIPILFCLLRDSEIATYEYMLRMFVESIPRLGKVEDLLISLDFDRDMISALQHNLKNLKLVGCNFHLKQAVNRWIDRNWKVPMQVAWRGEAISDLTALSRSKYSTTLEFESDCDKFLFKWTILDGGRFANYICRTWIGSSGPNYSKNLQVKDAVFPPVIWAASMISPSLFSRIEYTNNQAERFHERLNTLFQRKPGVKKFVWVLRRIESNYRTTHLFNIQNFANVLSKEEDESTNEEFRFASLRVAQPRVLDQSISAGELKVEDGYYVEEPVAPTNTVNPQSHISTQLPEYSPSPIVYESRTAVNKATRGKRKELDAVQRALQQIDSQPVPTMTELASKFKTL